MKPLIAFTLLFSSGAFSQPKLYRPMQKSGVQFHLPYTMGTHDGEAPLGKAQVFFDLENPGATTGEFRIPIDTMTTGNEERDCHMREALGLKYDQSDFPKEHVCSDSHHLPESGKNSVVFPEILFKISALKSLDKSGNIALEGETPIEVEGTWSIHGVSQKALIPMKITPMKQKFKVTGETLLSLKSFDITVKPAKVLFFTIEVKDQVKVNFDLTMETF
ncbi:MAG: YceI family protein [Bacteriovorax sp.]